MAISSIDKFRATSLKASEYGSPPYNWIPPVWEEGSGPPALEDTAAKAPDFPKPLFKCEREGEESPGEEKPDPGENGLEKWPHPCSDFRHIEPHDFDDGDFDTTKKKLGEHSAEFKKLKKIVGPKSLGMQRLALVFEWTLCQVTTLLGDINSTLRGTPDPNKGPDRVRYTEARQAYIDFLIGLDDREPETTGRPVVSGQSGYGRALKWAYIDPIILNGEIIAARVIVRWNPNVSSSGVPIPH